MEYWPILIVVAFAAYFLLGRKATSTQQIPTDYLPGTFVVLDLETTGLDANRHEIIEVAAIRYRRGSTNHQKGNRGQTTVFRPPEIKQAKLELNS